MDSLFKRERADNLDGYTPPFTREETLLHYRTKQNKVINWELDNEKPDEYVTYHFITVAGQEFQGAQNTYYGENDFGIVATIANEVLKYTGEKYVEAQAYLREHAHQLNCSKRYWQTWDHLQRIQAERTKVKELQKQIARAEIIASVNCLEVRAERSFSSQERQILLAEFNGGEFKADE